MSTRTYNRGPCLSCRARGVEQAVSNGGLAYVSHMRMHERRGEVIETAPGVWKDVLKIPTDALPYRYVKQFRPELLR